jgi:hypothetical protein
MRESAVERYLIKVTEQLGGECLKFVSPGRHGVNDRLVFLPGSGFYMIECKRPGEQLGPHQKRFRARMAELGFTVHVCDSIEWVDVFFADVMS